MIYRQLTYGDKTQAKELWKARFDDSEAFIEWYFNNRFLPKFSFGSFEGEELISISHGYPMRINVRKTVVPALMISGVATKAGHEGQGYMHGVIERQMRYAKEQGIPVAFNKPVNIDTYRSLGFVPCTDAMMYEYNATGEECSKEVASDYAAMHKVYCSVMERYSGAVVRDFDGFILKINDYLADDARIIASSDGYCVYFEHGDKVYAEETLSKSDYKALLALVCARTGKTVVAKLPPDCGLKGEIRPMNVYAACDYPLLCKLALGKAVNGDYTVETGLQYLFGYRDCEEKTSKIPCFCIDEY